MSAASTSISMPLTGSSSSGGGGGKVSGIVDDFMYSSNVASAHLYIRLGFLRKVYGILSVQLVFTTLIASLFMLQPDCKYYINQNPWVVNLAFFGSIVSMIGMFFKRHETPTNYILLAAFTLSMSLTIGTVVSFYDQMMVIEAFVMTAGVTVGLTTYTLQSKRDFSFLGAGLFAAIWALILGGILQMFMQNEEVELLLGVCGTIVFSLFIIYDTHQIMHKLSPEEYILATINLYMDIINLFLYILRLINAANRK